MSSKEDKKAEKARLKAEKEALKTAEKEKKKAEKERLALEKKEAKELKKKRKSGLRDSVASESVASTIAESIAEDPPESAAEAETSNGGDGPSQPEEPKADGVAAEPQLGAAESEPTPTEPEPEPEPEPKVEIKQNPITDDGISSLARAWMHAPETSWTTGSAPSTQLKEDNLDDENIVTLGEGVFGMVYETKISRTAVELARDGGLSEDVPVVIKKLAGGSSEETKILFVNEASAMEDIDHPNVLRSLGAITGADPMFIIYENHEQGDLKAFLSNARSTGIETSAQATVALDVAQGLKFLHSKSMVHMDLATRNCLVTVIDNKTVTRIGDYGLGRVKYPNDYSALGSLCDGTLPVRWMAPESLDSLEFSKASDMWSFGVTIWEILALGNQPYSTLSSSEVPGHVVSEQGLKLKSTWNDGLSALVEKLTAFEAVERLDIDAVIEKLSAVALAAELSGGDSPKKSEDAFVEKEDAYKRINMSRKSYRSLGTFKEAENPSEEFSASSSNVTELPREDLSVEKELGQGAFGVVVKGKLTRDDGSIVSCACKTLKDASNSESMDALIAESELVAGFDHPNVVACYGQITIGTPAMIVFEFMANGSLYGYLEDLPELPRLQRLMQMAIDTAKGMAHLEEKNFIHRDLATRNVLVAEDMTCKISDFGLSRDLDDDTYYESEGGMVPIRWTPPEAYKYKKYSTASDVWSYGITLYEVWTKAAIPYGKKWTNMNVMLNVEKGYRLPPPEGCPKAVYQLMVQCWNPRRKMRPTFASIKDRLEMAYDMLFPDEAAVENEVSIGDQDFGDLEQIYLGVEVPTEDNLDEEVYLMEPTPVKEEDKKPVTNEDKPKTYVGRDVALKPDRFSKDIMSLLNNTQQETARPGPGMLRKTEVPSPKPDRFANVGKDARPSTASVASVAADKDERLGGINGGKSLRKQKDYSEAVEVKDKVEYTSSAKVAEVLALSRQKEVQSAVEETGVARVAAMGIRDVKTSTFVESVGRAVDVKPVGQGQRKRCVCRRFKCVCGFK